MIPLLDPVQRRFVFALTTASCALAPICYRLFVWLLGGTLA